MCINLAIKNTNEISTQINNNNNHKKLLLLLLKFIIINAIKKRRKYMNNEFYIKYNVRCVHTRICTKSKSVCKSRE